jgi:hypothetical protein
VVFSPGDRRPVSQPPLSPEARRPVSQVVFSPGVRRPVSQLVLSPGVRRLVSQLVLSPGVRRLVSQLVLSPGVRRPVSHDEDAVPLSADQEPLAGSDEDQESAGRCCQDGAGGDDCCHDGVCAGGGGCCHEGVWADCCQDGVCAEGCCHDGVLELLQVCSTGVVAARPGGSASRCQDGFSDQLDEVSRVLSRPDSSAGVGQAVPEMVGRSGVPDRSPEAAASFSARQASVVERQTWEPVEERHSVVCRQRAPVARHSEVCVRQPAPSAGKVGRPVEATSDQRFAGSTA